MKDINQKLDTLYDLLIDNAATLKAELKALIAHPQEIKNTNKFASLISSLKDPTFIDPLLVTISLSNKEDVWLTDLLYAVTMLLGESSVNDEFAIPKSLTEKLAVWILDHTGELAWFAAGLLKYYETEAAEKIQLKKLEQRGDFFLVYVECMQGLLRYYPEKHIELVKQIASDETRDQKLREFAADVVSARARE